MTSAQEQTRRPAASRGGPTPRPPADRQGAPDADDDRWIPEGWLARIWDDVHRTGYRLRRQLLPHAACGAVAGTGMIAAELAAADVLSPAVLGTSMAAVGVPAALVTARQIARRRPIWRNRALLGGMAATGWLTVVPFTGVGAEHAAVLLTTEYLLAGRWWQINRIRLPGDAAGPPPPRPPGEAGPAAPADPTPDPRWPHLTAEQAALAREIIDDWATHVACGDGPVPKSVLTDPLATRHGLEFTLHLARGKQTFTSVTGALERIGTGLNRPVRDLIFEPGGDSDSPAQCRFQYLADNPIAGEVNFDGPRRVGGMLSLGPYADGNGDACWRLYTPGSMWGGVIIGGIGSGKSRVVENIVINGLSAGDTLCWYLDPQRGASSPALAERADWFTTMDGAGDMLDALEEILAARGEENAIEGWIGFTPSAQRPGLLMVIEECHRAFENPEVAKRWGYIAREGRKVGIALLCVSQYNGLITFGGNDALRSSVMEGNAIVLRVTSNSAKGLMPGLQVNPLELPKIPGYAYCNADPASGMRTAPFRNRDTDPDGGPGADHWLAAQPMPGLDRLSATATLTAGRAYHDRHQAGRTTRTASRQRVDALRRGEPIPASRGRTGQAAQPAAELGAVITFPPPLTQRPGQTATTLSQDQLSPSHRKVLDAVAAGHTRPSEIERAVGLRHRRVQYLLSELLAHGHLAKDGYGRYTTAA